MTILSLLFLLFLVLNAVATALAIASPNLQAQHAELSPADTLQQLSDSCKDLGISNFDIYGDNHLDDSESYLRQFESQIAQEFGKEDAVFMPSGVMAQSIALLIHDKKNKKSAPNYFACHHSSHLLIHEQDAYRELIGMEPLVIDTRRHSQGCHVPPMTYQDAKEAFDAFQKDDDTTQSLSTLILELPHRELGGKCTSWEDILQMKQLCNEHGVQFHCDGARIFEASCYYFDDKKSLSEIASVFDSVYISFYKGLGGISGAMLMGNEEFCDEARIWLRRFGGNLFTLLPYAVSGWTGYRQHWIATEQGGMTFADKYDKLRRLVAQISKDDTRKVVSFDPEIPQVNMVHGYFRHSVDEVLEARDKVEQETGYRVLNRVGSITDEEDPAYKSGYRSKFEWTMGASNGSVADDAFLKAWKALSAELS